MYVIYLIKIIHQIKYFFSRLNCNQCTNNKYNTKN